MKDKQYYTELANRYFDAETSVAEERELREFLATTADPDFEEVKVVMGFASMASRAYGFAPKARPKMLRPWAMAVAAAVVALLVMVPFVKGNNPDCLMIAEGETTTNSEEVISEMDREMALLFSSSEEHSVESEMEVIFN